MTSGKKMITTAGTIGKTPGQLWMRLMSPRRTHSDRTRGSGLFFLSMPATCVKGLGENVQSLFAIYVSPRGLVYSGSFVSLHDDLQRVVDASAIPRAAAIVSCCRDGRNHLV